MPEKENNGKDISEEILKKLSENKDYLISLNILLTKNKNNINILLNKVNKLAIEIERINNHIKWKRIWAIFYWTLILGSIFGIWYFIQNFLGEFLDFLTKFTNGNQKIENIVNFIRDKIKTN